MNSEKYLTNKAHFLREKGQYLIYGLLSNFEMSVIDFLLRSEGFYLLKPGMCTQEGDTTFDYCNWLIKKNSVI